MILHDFKICNSGLKNPKLLSILLMWFAFLLSNAWWCGGVVVWLHFTGFVLSKEEF